MSSLTEQVPLRKERRFRQTGRRISMLLKLAHLAEARAQANADCRQRGGRKVKGIGQGIARQTWFVVPLAAANLNDLHRGLTPRPITVFKIQGCSFMLYIN